MKAAYLGNHMEYSIRTEAGLLFVMNAEVSQPLAIGTAVKATPLLSGATIIGG